MGTPGSTCGKENNKEMEAKAIWLSIKRVQNAEQALTTASVATAKKKGGRAKVLTREQINQLFDVVLEINGLSARDQEYTGEAPMASFEFLGNTAGVYVQVYEKGWHTDLSPDGNFVMYADRAFGDSFEDCMRYLTKISQKEMSGGSQH